MPAARSSRRGPARGTGWEAPPHRRPHPLARVGRLLLSRRAAAALLGLTLLVLFGAPLAFAATGANTAITPARATAAAPNLAPTVGCEDPADRLENPGSCLLPPTSSTKPKPSTPTPTPTPTTPAPRATSDPPPNPELCATADAPPDCPPRDNDPDSDPGSDDEECQDDEGCLPTPTSTKPGSDGKPHKPKPAEPADECGITDPIACVTEGIDALFRGIVESALNPLLKFLPTRC